MRTTVPIDIMGRRVGIVIRANDGGWEIAGRRHDHSRGIYQAIPIEQWLRDLLMSSVRFRAIATAMHNRARSAA